MSVEHIRNIAIIAHVDHGKTTLVDQLLRQSGTLNERVQTPDRVMDSNDLERERGITILAKNTAITWNDYHINIVDTPGHADFGGEVERILSMVDSVLLIVDAVEGPMPQTRFVTQKAFEWGLKPIVVVNKVDRDGARPDWAVDQVFDLFVNLDASDEQLDFPVIYASAIEGFATTDMTQPSDNMTPLFECIVDKVLPPDVDINGPFQMQVSALDYSSYVGAIGIGRIKRGTLTRNMPITAIDREGKSRQARVLQILGFNGLERVEVESATAGDIVAVTGVDPILISDTLTDPDNPEVLPPLMVDEPTVSVSFSTNNSPLGGREGKYVTGRQIKDRLDLELISNVALRVEPAATGDAYKVSGRGELHLAILIETMRREGYELSVSRPEVVIKEIDGERCEPYESVVADVEEQHQGSVMEALAKRQGQLKNMESDGKGRVRLSYEAPTRGLIGFHSRFQTMTSGSGIYTHTFLNYAPVTKQEILHRKRGVLVSMAAGVSNTYALWNLQERGQMLIGPQVDVYEGMIVGLHSRDNDLVVNVTKEKQLTNVRASGTDDAMLLTPPIQLSLEGAMDFIDNDELLEITPTKIRLRKRYLKAHERKRAKNEGL